MTLTDRLLMVLAGVRAVRSGLRREALPMLLRLPVDLRSSLRLAPLLLATALGTAAAAQERAPAGSVC